MNAASGLRFSLYSEFILNIVTGQLPAIQNRDFPDPGMN
jgi:hypothetical protein